MAAIFGVPFLRPSLESVHPERWLLVGIEPVPIPDILPEWDYNTVLDLGRNIRVDTDRVRLESGLAADARLTLAARWSSPGTFQRGMLGTAEVHTGVDATALHGTLRGQDVASQLRIETLLILRDNSLSPTNLTATRAGTILWRDSVEVAVEGSAARFPVEVINFSEVAWAPSDAAWLLAWNAFELQQPFLGAVRLFINSEHGRVVRAAIGSASDAEAAAIRSTIYFDVGRALIRGALLNEEFRADPLAFEAGSVGSVVRGLVQSMFPGERPSTLIGMMQERSEFFDAILQSKLQLLNS